MQISTLLRQSTQQLAANSGSARLDAEILLAHCLKKPRSFLYTWPEHVPTLDQLKTYNSLLAQRIAGQPVAYLTGYREFWGLPLKVTPNTLIPRPDTELLVETALQICQAQTANKALNILDLGTGSGAIALALASELPTANIIATDQSAEALDVAKENAQQHQLQQISFIHSNWFDAIPNGLVFDLIISNPPYIAAHDPHLSCGDVRFEPITALVAGDDGLDDIRHLIINTQPFLRIDGVLMLEHGYDQAHAIKLLLQQSAYSNIEQLKDLAGNDRISYGHYYTM